MQKYKELEKTYFFSKPFFGLLLPKQRVPIEVCFLSKEKEKIN